MQNTDSSTGATTRKISGRDCEKNCPDRTEYTDDDSPILAGKIYCERWGEVKDHRGWPISMMCNEILAAGKCPGGYNNNSTSPHKEE